MDASNLPKLKSSERNTDGTPLNRPGVYKNKDNGELFITADGGAGILQADYLMKPFWKDLWEWTGPVPTGEELLAMRQAQEVKDATEEALQAGKEAEQMKAAKKKALEEAKAAA